MDSLPPQNGIYLSHPLMIDEMRQSLPRVLLLLQEESVEVAVQLVEESMEWGVQLVEDHLALRSLAAKHQFEPILDHPLL